MHKIPAAPHRAQQLTDPQDRLHENAIWRAWRALVSAKTVSGQYAAWWIMRALIFGRSPVAIAHLERLRGLDVRR